MLTSSFVGPRDAKRSEWKQWVQSRLHDTIAQLQHAKASDIYKILQPKKMVDKKKGKRGKPLPGLQDADGVWKTSRQEVAIAWQRQFAAIENAEHVEFSSLLKSSKPKCEAVSVRELGQIPTLYDLEAAMRAMCDRKAAGVDCIGAKAWQMQIAHSAMRLFPLFLKSAIRRQAVVEHTGGWTFHFSKETESLQDVRLQSGFAGTNIGKDLLQNLETCNCGWPQQCGESNAKGWS
jgi:hypothetical protein